MRRPLDDPSLGRGVTGMIRPLDDVSLNYGSVNTGTDCPYAGLCRGRMQGQCIPDRCVPEQKFLHIASLVLFVP
jgi:hypothetical protein